MKKIFFSSPFLFTLFTHVARAVDIQLNAPIGYGGEKTPTELPQYINYLFPFAISLTAIAAVGALVVGGVLYITAGALPESVNRARSIMLDAILGMLVVIGSYLVLNTINPDLVSLRAPKLDVGRRELTQDEKNAENISNISLDEVKKSGVKITPGAEKVIKEGGNASVECPSGFQGTAILGIAKTCVAVNEGKAKFNGAALESVKRACDQCGIPIK